VELDNLSGTADEGLFPRKYVRIRTLVETSGTAGYLQTMVGGYLLGYTNGWLR
jgi:hypothetical protein